MKVDPRRLLRECPTVVGMVTSTLESGGSIDSAMRNIASSGPQNSRSVFETAVRMVDTKQSASATEGLASVLDSLPRGTEGYRRSLSMCIAASESSDAVDRTRMLRDASDTALDSVRSMGEAYSASLTFPCMAVFGIGIMVPMVLMSLLPMLGIGGMFGASSIDENLVVLITLVLIPLGIVAMTLWVRRSNPFLSGTSDTKDIRFALPLLSAIPLSAVHISMGYGADSVLLFSMAPASVATIVLMADEYRRRERTRKCEAALMDCVFDMGNRMLSGENFGSASVGAMSSFPECADVAESLSRGLELSRGDIPQAISDSISPVSSELSSSIRDIYSCSERDNDDAGRLAVILGRQYHNQGSAMMSLRIRLKSMTDMMFGTAMVFAPMVLGMSVSMLEPLSEIAGYSGMDGTPIVLSAYLVELNMLIALLTSSIGSGEGFHKGLWRFCVMCPVSLMVFAICDSIRL